MKNVVIFSILIVCAIFFFPVLFSSCGNSTSTTPTPTPPIPDCQKYHTGVLEVSNRSTRNLDYEIIIDGIDQGRLAVGATKDYTVAAGSHSLEFKYADHSQDACTMSYPNVIECQTYSIYCTG